MVSSVGSRSRCEMWRYETFLGPKEKRNENEKFRTDTIRRESKEHGLAALQISPSIAQHV